MHTLRAKRIVIVLVVGVIATSITAAAQNQNQSIWQRIKNSAKQTEQNSAQQVQQQMPGAVNQMNGQSPCGSLAGAGGAAGNLTNTAFSGGASGSCGQNCFNAGPFAAAVSQMTMSQQSYWHVIRMEIQFHNATNQPIALAYHEGSMEMVDELGNAYQGAGGNPGELQGMGIDRGGQTDSQFVLGPGQTSSAIFTVARARNSTQPIGTSFTYNLTVDQLQAQNGAQAIVGRQYNLNFPNLAPGSAGGAFPSSSPSNSFVGGAGNATSGVASYVGAGSSGSTNSATTSASSSGRAIPVQRTAVNAQTPTAANNRRGAVSNAALKSTPANATKPSAAVRAIPAKTSTAKEAKNTTTNK